MGETTNEVIEEKIEEKTESSAELRAGIEQTREDMSGTIDELQGRLKPERLKADAKAEAVRRAQNFADDTKETVSEITQQFNAAPTPKEKGAVLLDAVKRHPVPAAALGLGVLLIGWKALRGKSD